MGILDGVKVVDFTHAYAGPFTTINLADFGAEVIKIERIGSGDVARGWGPFKNDYSGYYASFNRNKRSMTLDITSEEGQEIIFNLVKDADIVCSNFKAGTLDKYGIGYEKIRKIKPDIIYATISGFGEQGVLSKFAAYDNVVQALSGIMELTGFEDKTPTKIGPAIGDSFTGLMLLLGVVMAYYNKLNTGKGQKVDVTMLGSLMAMLENPIMSYTAFGEKPSRKGNINMHYAPSDVYKVADGYITIAVKNQDMWKNFCDVIGAKELVEDTRFADNSSRIKNNAELKNMIEAKCQSMSKSDLVASFESKNIPSAVVMDIVDAFKDKQLEDRNMIVELDDPGAGPLKVVGNPMKLSETPPVIDKPAPLLGQHTDEILKEIGYNEKQIENFRNNRAI